MGMLAESSAYRQHPPPSPCFLRQGKDRRGCMGYNTGVKGIHMDLAAISQPLAKRHIALPTDHGSWVFLLMPLVIGLVAGGSFSAASLYLILAAMAAFLMRQPITIAVKALSGRRARRELAPAGFWILIYALLGLASVAGLLSEGFGWLLYLALPGGPVFAWHLYLVSRRQERRQALVEVIGSGVLALAAPAACWVGAGEPSALGWWLFALVWAQSAASILYAYLRLEQRSFSQAPPLPERLRMALPALIFTGINLLGVLALALAGLLPPLLPLPYALQFGESLWGGLVRPAAGYRPTAIGVRQLIVSSLFTLLFILAL